MIIRKNLMTAVLIILSLLTLDLSAGQILKTGKKLYSQLDEELIIRDFFNDKRDGVFVDIGCADYKRHSTTYYLEKHLGWSGIGVDAISGYEAGYIKNRPNTKFFAYIVTNHSGEPMEFYQVKKEKNISSTDEEYVKYKLRNVAEKRYKIIRVPTITLTELLEKNGISKIDFLSMDIEKSEPAALAGFDIEKFKPELVCIESTYNKDKLLDYFTRHNYERIEEYLRRDFLNWYFRPKE